MRGSATASSSSPTSTSAPSALQDLFELHADSAQPLEKPDYDEASLDATRKALLPLASGIQSFDRTFGAEHDVDPVRHLIGTAAGWGGLPTTEATYIGVNPGLPPVPTSSPWATWWVLLVDLGVQRRRLLRAQPGRRIQRHRDAQ
jgi:hypothetical protein